MLNDELKTFYDRDIRKLIGEINLFTNDEDLWRTHGSVKNAAGNLALHIIGGSNYLFGTVLAKTGYVRHRDEEFTRKNVPREEIVAELEKLSLLISSVLTEINLKAEYPIPFDDAKRTNGYVLIQLALHLNYHLGQVNYLRRGLE